MRAKCDVRGGDVCVCAGFMEDGGKEGKAWEGLMEETGS